jgi:flagellar hook-associated protein 3 FlgL
MRISDGMMARRALLDIQRANSAMNDASQQVTTGKRILRPSDDPAGTEKALRLRADLAQTAQHKRNVDDAEGWAQATDTALGGIGDVLARVRDLTVQAGSGALSVSDRKDIALEVDQLISQMKSAANGRYGEQYVLAGQESDAPPYDPDGADTYQGDAGAVVRTIGPSVSVRLNTTGDTLLGDGDGTDGKLLSLLRGISSHLKGGTTADTDALRTTDLKALDTGIAEVLTARAEAGTLSNRLTAAAARLDDLAFTTENARSDVEDADAAEAYLQYSAQQTVYESALRATSGMLQQRSLMDFLN